MPTYARRARKRKGSLILHRLATAPREIAFGPGGMGDGNTVTIT